MPAHLVRSFLAVAVVAGLSTACRTPVEPEGTVTAAIVGDSLRIDNGLRGPVFFSAVEGGAAAQVSIIPRIVSTPECPAIPSGSVMTIPLTDIHGFEPGSETVQITWWRPVPGRTVGTFEAGPGHVLHVHR